MENEEPTTSGYGMRSLHAGVSGKAHCEVTFEPKTDVNDCTGDWVQNIVDGGRGKLSAKEA